MNTDGKVAINVDALKRQVKDLASTAKDDASIDAVITKLAELTTVHAAPAPVPAVVASK